MGSPEQWTHVGTSTANKSEQFPGTSSTRAPVTELYKCYVTTCSHQHPSNVMFRLPGVCLPAPASHFAINTSKMTYRIAATFSMILKQFYLAVFKKSGLFCNTFLRLDICFQSWHNTQTSQPTLFKADIMLRQVNQLCSKLTWCSDRSANFVQPSISFSFPLNAVK